MKETIQKMRKWATTINERVSSLQKENKELRDKVSGIETYITASTIVCEKVDKKTQEENKEALGLHQSFDSDKLTK